MSKKSCYRLIQEFAEKNMKHSTYPFHPATTPYRDAIEFYKDKKYFLDPNDLPWNLPVGIYAEPQTGVYSILYNRQRRKPSALWIGSRYRALSDKLVK